MKFRKCNKCRLRQKETEFNYRNKKNNKRHNICKKCYSKTYKKYYKIKRTKLIKRSKITTDKLRERNCKFLYDYLLNHPCVDCGNDNPIVLDFDHKNGSKKEYNVSVMAHKASSIEMIEKEIAKCDVRCANCHRIKTAKQIKNRKWKYMNNSST